jgi:hypothetical protein
MVVSYVFNISTTIYVLVWIVCISSHALNRRRQVTVRFTGHSRIVGPQYGTFFMSPVWHLEFGGGFQIFEQSVDTRFPPPALSVCKFLAKSKMAVDQQFLCSLHLAVCVTSFFSQNSRCH